MERALETIELFAHFCRATGIDDVRPVATSAIRDATNRKEFLKRARKQARLEIDVLSPEQEARYGYLAAVNSTSLADGVALDLGGGSLQLVQVAERHEQDARSWPLGAVRMTERFLPDEKSKRKQLKALRAHVRKELSSAGWLADAGATGWKLAGIGGTRAQPRHRRAARRRAAVVRRAGLRCSSARRLTSWSTQLAGCRRHERGDIPGIKHERGDLILAGAVVIQEVMERRRRSPRSRPPRRACARASSSRTLLEDRDPPLFEDVRRDSVLNLAATYQHRLHPRRARRQARARDAGTRSPRAACTAATRASATCCGPRRCCTTSARRSTTTTTTSTRAT